MALKFNLNKLTSRESAYTQPVARTQPTSTLKFNLSKLTPDLRKDFTDTSIQRLEPTIKREAEITPQPKTPSGFLGFQPSTVSQQTFGTPDATAYNLEQDKKGQLKALQEEARTLAKKKLFGGGLTDEEKARQADVMSQALDLEIQTEPGTTGVLSGFTGGLSTEALRTAKPETVADIEQDPRFKASELGGEIGRQAATFGIVSPMMSGGASAIPGFAIGQQGISNAVKSLGLTQATDLFVDTLAQAPTEIITAVSEDKTMDEFSKDFVFNRFLDVAMNMGLQAGGEIIKTMLNNPNTKAVATKAIQTDPEFSVLLKEAREPSVDLLPTAKTYLETGEPLIKETPLSTEIMASEIPGFLQGSKQSSQEVLEGFSNWRKQNFGGAFGDVRPSEMDALLEMYKQDTGIDVMDVLQKNMQQEELLKQFEGYTPETADGDFLNMTADDFQSFRDIKNIFEDSSIIKLDDIPRTETAKVELMPELEATAKLTKDGRVMDSVPYLKNAKAYTDLKGVEGQTTDVFRLFKKVFGSDFGSIKKDILDPLDAGKGAMVDERIAISNDLKKSIVDEFGFKPKSEESAWIQKFGEGRESYEAVVEKFGQEKADNIVQADAWFRENYDRLIDEVNEVRAELGMDLVPKRENYYSHFSEVSGGLSKFWDVVTGKNEVSPRMITLSDSGRAKEAYASFKKQRRGGEFVDDAITGFLDYLDAATYSKHIDPHIGKFRNLSNDLKEATDGVGLKKLVDFTEQYADSLAGKRHKLDKVIRDDIGADRLMNVLTYLNNRYKSNAVLGNLSSSVAQLANIPQGIATVKDPQSLVTGFKNSVGSLTGGGDKALYDQSSFLKERTTDIHSQFETRLVDQPKKFAKWMLGVLDEASTKFIWSSVYDKALKDGIENPIKHADDVTRSLVAGRGIGELPLAQQSEVVQLLAPFTVEVGNLWKVQKDFINEKDFGGLAALYGLNFLFNKGMEEIKGSGVVFDPVDAIVDGVTQGDTAGEKLFGTAQRLSGEVGSNIPGGSTIAQLLPEQQRQTLFGEADPTRFGTGLPISGGLTSPEKFATSFLTPFGGAQIRKTTEGAQALGLLPEITPEGLQTRDVPVSISKGAGEVRTTIDPTLLATFRGLAFGEYSIPEVAEFFDKNRNTLGEIQGPGAVGLVKKGYDSDKLMNAIFTIREKGLTKKADRLQELSNLGYTSSEVDEIAREVYSYKGGN